MKLSVCVGVLLLAATLHAHAEVPVQVSTCAGCHGAEGQGNPALGAPRLAGQQAEYILAQLHAFKAGRRGYDDSDRYGAQMRALVIGLGDSDMEHLAHYYSSLSLDEGREVKPNPDAHGKALFQATCTSCHGPKGEGFAHLKTPNLSILDAAYVERQLAHYVQGVRGGEGHADELGVWMRGISLQVESESERKAIARYIGSLTNAAK